MDGKQIKGMGFLSTDEAACVLGLSPATLRTWRALDKGPKFYKFNRAVFYRTEDIEA